MEKQTPLKRVRPPAHELPSTGADLAALAGGLAPAERQRVESAWALAEPILRDARLAGGEPALSHALETAAIVSELKMDGEAMAAALLVPAVERDPGCLPKVKEHCGSVTADLVDGVIRMAQISALSERGAAAAGQAGEEAQLEQLRKMLLAMVQDVRVVLVKLAGHLQELRFAVRAPDSGPRRVLALLTQDLFAPLANRLGVWQLKWEMEDLALRVLEPEPYKRIAQLLDGKRADRERYIENVVAYLKSALARTGIHAEISGRPKHIFSIYKKIREKDSNFESLYDVRAVRVLVDDVSDCYAALGIIHQLWTPIPREFDDYIAKPKANHYRSLHTAVIGPEDKALEVQIRTREMHQHAELGVASHWRYKEGSRSDHGYDQKIAWLRQVLEWKDLAGDAGELAARFRTGLFEDTIYTLTPQGRVIALPKGATPIDFAYHVHSELGHRCRGAMVDGAIVPLNTPLANGQRVEIMAAREGGPSRDWLNPALGYVRSNGARTKIRQWFNRQHHDAAVAQGRSMVEKELQRLGLTRLNLERLAAALDFAKLDDFLAEAGRGAVGSRQIQIAAHVLVHPQEPAAAPRPVAPGLAAAPGKRRPPAGKGGVLVVGVDRLLTVPAKCCKPAPPDAIVGFITRKRGVTIHRANCANLKRLVAERRLDVEWGEAAARVPRR